MGWQDTSGFYALGKLMRIILVKGIRRSPSVRTVKEMVGQLWSFENTGGKRKKQDGRSGLGNSKIKQRNLGDGKIWGSSFGGSKGRTYWQFKKVVVTDEMGGYCPEDERVVEAVTVSAFIQFTISIYLWWSNYAYRVLTRIQWYKACPVFSTVPGCLVQNQWMLL